MKNNKKLNCYDLCCGAGIFSLGFKKAGFKIIGGIDNDKNSIETVRKNIPEGKWELIALEKFIEKIEKKKNPI